MSDNDLPLDRALQILRESDARSGQSILLLMIAAGVIMDHCETPDVTLEDLLRCLDHGELVAEFGARGLYVRTNRDGFGQTWPDDISLLVLDRPNWEKYLRENNWWKK